MAALHKFNMADAWSQAAEAYVHFMKSTEETAPRLDMAQGRNEVVHIVVSALAGKANPVILDVASAGGEPALTMAKEMPHATVHGTDFASRMVDHLRERAEEAGVTNLIPGVEDGQELSGFPDGSVDAVTCTWGLESMPERQKAIEQMYRVLRNDGIAVFAAWDKDPNSIAMKMSKVMPTLKGEKSIVDSADFQSLGGENGAKAMGDAGFVEVTVKQMSIPMYLPDGFALQDVFTFMTCATPFNAALGDMEAAGRPNVRQEAREIFERQVLKDIEEGRAPTGHGLPPVGGSMEGKPAFEMKALIVSGRKRK